MSLEHQLLAGIFIGGASSRMHGRPKGLLPAPGSGESLIERWRQLFDRAGIPHVLVGRRTEYAALAGPVLDDDPPGIGPLGGLAALLGAAGTGHVVSVACDMPFVTDTLIRRLIEHPLRAAALAARRGGRWEPLFARYEVARTLPVVARRARGPSSSLQGVLDELDAEELPLSDDEHRLLRDWDAPGDMRDMEEP